MLHVGPAASHVLRCAGLGLLAGRAHVHGAFVLYQDKEGSVAFAAADMHGKDHGKLCSWGFRVS